MHMPSNTGLGIRSSVFWANHSFFAKNEQIAHLLKKTSDLLIRSFLVSNLSDLFASLIKKREWANRSFFLNLQKTYQKIRFNQTFWANRSFFGFCERNSKWAICSKQTEQFSNSLFYHERPEQIAHNRTFVMSDLSDLLTVALLTWATWGIHWGCSW